jgi:hypothetical protein
LAALAAFQSGMILSVAGASCKASSSSQGEAPQLKISPKGNSNFRLSFSTPPVTCPGAGECLDFCYSAHGALLHFFASAKMHLMRFNREAITQALAAIPGNFEMRLYVDGDFANMQDVDFGCRICVIHKSRLTGTAKLCAVVGLQPCQYVA